MIVSHEAILRVWRERVRRAIIQAFQRHGINCECADGRSCYFCQVADTIVEELERPEAMK